MTNIFRVLLDLVGCATVCGKNEVMLTRTVVSPRLHQIKIYWRLVAVDSEVKQIYFIWFWGPLPYKQWKQVYQLLISRHSKMDFKIIFWRFIEKYTTLKTYAGIVLLALFSFYSLCQCGKTTRKVIQISQKS